MTTGEGRHTGAGEPRAGGHLAGLLRPPLRDLRFWVVQAAVLTLAGLHDVVLVDLHAHYLAGVPAPITSGLLLIPVIYAALNFGVRGAVGTALSATALIVPHWFLIDLTPEHFWIEVGYLVILNVVAVVVGQRVEREQRARHRAEVALRMAQEAQARYYALFEDQPAAVIITDSSGVVVEVNSAAAALLTPRAPGRPLVELLGVEVGDLVLGRRQPLWLDDAHGRRVLLVPTAHRVATADGAELVQVVLSDVTEEERRQAEQRLLAGRLLRVQEEERRRLARELHDEPLQNLAYLSRALDDLGHRPGRPEQLVAELQRAGVVAAEASTALRKIIHGLRPPVLDDLGLVSALRQLVQEARTRSTLATDLRVSGEETRLPPDLELAAYRIAQEALNNAIRHADGTRVSVRLHFGATVVLTVSDDGRGIDDRRSGRVPDGSGLGLVGMRERVAMAGGTLEVSARRPRGTRVRATLPVRPVGQGSAANPGTTSEPAANASS